MQIKSFEDLIIWQKGHQLVIHIYKITKNFPPEERYGLSAQMRRSSASICANIAEGYTKSTKDFLRYLEIARGSLEETKYHVILARDLKFGSQEEVSLLIDLINEIGKMITALIFKLKMYLV